MKNHKIAYNSVTAEAREKKQAQIWNPYILLMYG